MTTYATASDQTPIPLDTTQKMLPKDFTLILWDLGNWHFASNSNSNTSDASFCQHKLSWNVFNRPEIFRPHHPNQVTRFNWLWTTHLLSQCPGVWVTAKVLVGHSRAQSTPKESAKSQDIQWQKRNPHSTWSILVTEVSSLDSCMSTMWFSTHCSL